MRAAAWIALACAAGCHGEPRVPEGDVVASLTAPPLAPFDPASLRGRPAVVMFVSPGCPHCQAELPRAQTAATAEGASVVAVFVAGNRSIDRAFLAQSRFDGPALLDDGSLQDRYDVDHVPYTLVVDAEGHARAAFVGERDEATLRDAISRAR